MSLFGMSKSSKRYGVLIDIGSGSVLTAIVYSDPAQKHPEIIWAHREHAPLRNVDSLEQSAKAVMTALVNSSMMLDAEGRKALYDHSGNVKLTELQCSIAAPWSYTVTKTINYNQEESFRVTENLLDDLIETINNKIENDLKENDTVQNLGLQVVTRTTMDILSNGYHVKHPEGQQTKQLTISRASVVTQQYLVDALTEMHNKLFPSTTDRKISFALMLFVVTREVLSQIYDVCLIDVTYEATEIGIVRDGVLKYCTHTPYGSFSLAREISKVTNVPLHEAFGYLHTETPYAFMKSLPKEQADEVEKVIEAYIERVSLLFKETGDELSIPKQISLHADLKSEPLFLDMVEKAAKRNLKTEPLVTPISEKILKFSYQSENGKGVTALPTDTALLLSAQFFHTQRNLSRFEFL